jgi:hypothetical protein
MRISMTKWRRYFYSFIHLSEISFTLKEIQPKFYIYCQKRNLPISWKHFPQQMYRIIVSMLDVGDIERISRGIYKMRYTK